MTVAELIDKLQALPQNAVVVRFDGNEEDSLAQGVQVRTAAECYTYNCGGDNELHFLKQIAPDTAVVEVV